MGGELTYSFSVIADTGPVGAPVVTSADARRLAVRPNPTRGEATVSFDLPRAAAVTLGLFDVRGRRVHTLLDGDRMTAGRHAVRLPAGELTPGVYFASWEGGGERQTAKVTVVR